MGAVTGGGKGGGGSSSGGPTSYTDLSPIANELGGISTDLLGLAGQQEANAQPLITGGQSQYEAGLTGQLTPAQQALTANTLNQMNVGTASNFANLGLGGSTMEQQDLNANQLASLAQTEGILNQDETLGMTAQQLGEQIMAGAGTSFGQAGNMLTGEANLFETQNQTYLQQLQNAKSALGSVAGQAAGGGQGSSGIGGIGTALGSLFSGLGGGGGAAAGNAALDVTGASGGFDLGAGSGAGAVLGDAAKAATAAA